MDKSYVPSKDTILAVLHELEPGSKLLRCQVAPGSFSNFTYLVETETPKSTIFKFAIRVYNVENEGVTEKARREYQALQLLNQHQIPAPEPMLLDDTGRLLGSAGIVVTFVDGLQNLNPENPERWARSQAEILAKIHHTPCDPVEQDALYNANTEALWFLRYRDVPPFMAEHPDGPTLWEDMRGEMLYLKPVRPALIHLDFWAGNILWQGDHISAVVDWEEAAYGDPAVDVAHAYRDIDSMGFTAAAKTFLEVYEGEVGHRIENLAFWSLASAVRQMPDPAAWVGEGVSLGQKKMDAEEIRTHFREFVADARRQLDL